MADPATTTPTPTTPAPTSGQQGMTLLSKILIVLAAGLIVGRYIGALFGADGGSIMNVLMLLLLSGIIIDHLRPGAAVDDSMILKVGKTILIVGTLSLVFMLVPWAVSGTVALGDKLLPEYTAQAWRRLVEHKDLRTAHRLHTDDNEGMVVAMARREQIDLMAAKRFADRTDAILQRDGTNTCWGWDDKTRTSIPGVLCTPSVLAPELQAAKDAYTADYKAAETMRPTDEPESTTTTASTGTSSIKEIWTGFWSGVGSAFTTIRNWLVLNRPDFWTVVAIVFVIFVVWLVIAIARMKPAPHGSH